MRYVKYTENYKCRVVADCDAGTILIYAIIKIDSSFNPYAVSSALAHGMMQLVPSSGGREAYRKAKGEDAMPGKKYLFDAGNNIEPGSTAWACCSTTACCIRYAPVLREYCVIAAYNTGPGNFISISKVK